MRHLVSAIIGISALGALISAVIPGGSGRVARVVALAVTTVALVLSLTLWVQFEPRGLQWQFFDQGAWLSSLGLSYSVGVDGFGALVILLTTLATSSALLLTSPRDDRAGGYTAVLALETGVLGAVATLNFAWFLAFWILAVFAARRLLRVWSSSDLLLKRFTRYVSLATVAVSAGIAVLVLNVHAITGAYTFDIRTYQQLGLPVMWQGVAFAAFAVAFAITSGAFPLHRAHHSVIAETPAAVWIPIGVVWSTLGSFALFRLSLPILPDAVRAGASTIAVVSMVGAGFAIARAIRQSDLAPLAAYASVAQVSLALWSSTALTPGGLAAAVVQVVGHSMVMVMLGVVLAGATVSSIARWTVGIALGIAAGVAIYPASALDRVETSVARVILRVSPQHAAEVADCLTASQAPPPPPDIPGLPAGAAMAAPCDTTKP